MAAHKTGLTIRCETCQCTFYVPLCRASSARFCSSKCYVVKEGHRIGLLQHERRAGKWLTCPECGKTFYRHPSTQNRLRCSKRCANKYIGRLYKGNKRRTAQLREAAKLADHTTPQTRARLSIAMHKAIAEGRLILRRGPENNQWKGGITPLASLIRHCSKYSEWRTQIFTRDDYSCQNCHIRGGILHADHCPIPFATIVERYKLRTLEAALKCAKLWDTNNGRTLCKTCHQRRHGLLPKKVELPKAA
jgi:endogenous inhibitor of DNA gyrase (YacG/DUF329 family)